MNDNGAAMLQKLGTDVAQIQMQKEKAAADKAKYRQELMYKNLERESEFQKSVMPQVDGAKLADEILEQGLTEIKNIASQEKDVFSKQKELTGALMKLKANSEAFKAPFSMLDEYYKGLPDDQKKGFDLAGAQNYVRQQLQLNDGTVSRYKTAEEIGDPTKIVGNIMGGSQAYQFWTPASGREAVDKDLKEMQPTTISIDKRDQKGLVRTGEKVEVQFKPLIQEFDEANGKVKLKTDALGYINDEAYDKYVADPKVNSWLQREAIRIADQHNKGDLKTQRETLEAAGIKNLDKEGGWSGMIVPDTPEFNYIKKGLLTRYLSNYTNQVQKDIDSKTIVSTNNFYGNQNQSNSDSQIPAPVQRIKNIVNGQTSLMGDPIKVDGATAYDVTGDFKTLPIYKDLMDKTYGPKSVTYYPQHPKTGKPAFEVIEKEYKAGKKKGTTTAPVLYDVKGFADFIIPKTEGTGYDPNPKKKAY